MAPIAFLFLVLLKCLAAQDLFQNSQVLSPSSYNDIFQTWIGSHIRRRPRQEFVKAPGDGHLYLGQRLFDFRGFNAPTLLEGGDYQAKDLLLSVQGFGTPVTRTYTLRVANTKFGGYIPPSSGQIIGWDLEHDDWIYNETKWQQIDRVMDMSHRHGVKLIIPIINQDYGTSSTNFVGNFNDLIRHRYNITDYRSANTMVDWFTDAEMLRVYQKLLGKFLNRINTVNHRRYGDDDTILAIETGNEMNWGSLNSTSFMRPPPANKCNLNVAAPVDTFSRATHQVTSTQHPCYGCARNIKLPTVWEEEVLRSSEVDLFSYHLYGDSDAEYFSILNEQVRRYNKTLIIGEHGFYSKIERYRASYTNFTCAGALIWSLTAHAEEGGFVTHSEGKNIYSYHIPGWEVQTETSFDTQEHEVVRSTYEASFNILGFHPPLFPIPGRPHAFFVTNGTHPGLSWRGAAWAYRYEIFGAHVQDYAFRLVGQSLNDNVGAGSIFLPLDPHHPTKKIKVVRLPVQPERSHEGWVDEKWFTPQTSLNEGLAPRSPHPHPRQPTSLKTRDYVPLSIRRRALEGGWWMIRGVSVDGQPGPFSKPIFLTPYWKTADRI